MIKILHGDCAERMKDIESESIDMVITSPPYDNLRKYNGFSFDFETIAKELYRVVKKGGVVVWVVGDATINGSETGTSFKQALYFKEIGFKLHDTMIYEKQNPIPQNHNRYEQCFEYMFVLSKGKPKTFNPIRIPTKTAGSKVTWNRSKMDDNQCARPRDEKTITKDTKIKKNIFTYVVGSGKTGHPAVFPEKLAEDQILSWSNPGDLILDPFIGSGTSMKMSILNNRNCIGIEISEEYIDIIKDRVKPFLDEELIIEKKEEV